jgi:hypothetical protein
VQLTLGYFFSFFSINSTHCCRDFEFAVGAGVPRTELPRATLLDPDDLALLLVQFLLVERERGQDLPGAVGGHAPVPLDHVLHLLVVRRPRLGRRSSGCLVSTSLVAEAQGVAASEDGELPGLLDEAVAAVLERHLALLAVLYQRHPHLVSRHPLVPSLRDENKSIL